MNFISWICGTETVFSFVKRNYLKTFKVSLIPQWKQFTSNGNCIWALIGNPALLLSCKEFPKAEKNCLQISEAYIVNYLFRIIDLFVLPSLGALFERAEAIDCLFLCCSEKELFELLVFLSKLLSDHVFNLGTTFFWILISSVASSKCFSSLLIYL